MTEGISIYSINTKGGINSNKIYKLINDFKNKKWDIIILQEIPSIKDRYRIVLEEELDCKIYVKQMKGGSRNIGVGTIIANSADRYITSVETIDTIGEGRLQKIKLEINGKKIRLYNIYGTTYDTRKAHQWVQLDKLLNKKNYNIIMGDVNTILHIDDRMGNLTKNKVDTNLVKLLENNSLLDLATHLDNKTHTYISHQATSLLDRVLVTSSEVQDIKKYTTELCYYSDHNYINIQLFQNMNAPPRPKIHRHWKLNTSLLDMIHTKTTIADHWEEWRIFQDNFNTHMDWYLAGKKVLKGKLINIGKNESRKRHDQEQKIIHQLSIESNSQQLNKQNYTKLKNELNQLHEYKIEGLKIRSREITLPNEERGSRQFHNIINKKLKQPQLTELINEDNQLVNDASGIKHIIESFYKKLYSREQLNEGDIESLIANYNTPEQLSRTDLDDLDRPIELKEITKALQKMSNNKSPGPDGLPKEYYVVNFEHIKYDLLGVYHEMSLHDVLPHEFTTGIIKLLYKKGNSEELKNWRPISLLNVDLKILTSIIATRLSEISNKIIGEHQKCGVKGRYIFENNILIENILNNYEFNNNKSKMMEGGIIMGLDMQKAFDRVDHAYLFKLLEKINIGHRMTEMIKLLYNQIHQLVETPYGHTNHIPIYRGIRQGCALSMILFTISIEPLLQMIDKKLEGIKIMRNCNIRTLAYADDTVIFAKNEIDKTRMLQLIEIYQKGSGAKINQDKTQELRLNRNESIDTEIEITGIIYTINKQNRTTRNWTKIIHKVRQKISGFNCRDLTIMGKATILNTYIISIITYISRIIAPSAAHVKQLNKIFQNFIFRNRPHGYSYKDITRNAKLGGFGIPNLENKLKTIQLMWQKYYKLHNNDSTWKTLLRDSQGSLHPTINLRNLDRDTSVLNFEWTKTESKFVYWKLQEKTIQHYDIEQTTRHMLDWDVIWLNWYKRNLDNKIKIEIHRVLTEKLTEEKVVNRSGNCPGCDYAFHISRDHIFLNCRGVQQFKQTIERREKIGINVDMFFGKSVDEDAAIKSYLYMHTIIMCRYNQKGKWGTFRVEQLNDFYNNSVIKHNTTATHEQANENNLN